MNRSPLIGLIFLLAGSVAYSADETWSNVSHSLSRFGHDVRNTFAEDADDRPSPTPRRHSKSSSKHSSTKKTKAKTSPAEKSDASDADSATSKPSPEPSAGASTSVPAEEGGIRFE